MEIGSKSNWLCVVALVLILPAILLSCGSKNATDAAQTKDSTFVFSTPKVLKVGEYVENNIGKRADLTTKMKDTTDLLRLSDIADEVEYVLLKTSNGKQEVFIGCPGPRMFMSKDYIFVVCSTVIQYDHQGNLIRTIGRQGSGPGEYSDGYTLFAAARSTNIRLKESLFDQENAHILPNWLLWTVTGLHLIIPILGLTSTSVW
jgi:hypothetical protein